MNFEDYYVMPVGKTETGFDIAAVEKKYNSVFMGDFCLKTKGGGWSESPVAIFWQENPPNNYSNYMGLLIQNGTGLITSGASAFSEPIMGIVADNGEVIFSRYRHDCRWSSDKSVMVDGGRDYTRCAGNIHNPAVHLIPDGSKLKIVPLPEEEPRLREKLDYGIDND